MRKLLLATTAATLVLGLGGGALADRYDKFIAAGTLAPPASDTLAPARSTTPRGLLFSKNVDEAIPIEQPVADPPASDDAAPVAQPEPAEQVAPDDQQATPADQATAPIEQMKPAIAAEDVALADQLRDLVENKLSHFVPKQHDRAGVLAFYRDRNFAPLWIAGGAATPRAQAAVDFLHGVEADGLDPDDYPTPAFGNADPAKLAADELTLTNSVVRFARHAGIGRVAFSRVSGAVWFDRKPPEAADVLAELSRNGDVRAALDAFNPQAPGYKALKRELAALRSGKDVAPEPSAAPQKEAKGKRKKHKHADSKAHKPVSKSARIDTVIANMERWRWIPHDLGTAYVMVNIPDYTLKVVQNGRTVWQTKIVVGKPGTHATPLLTKTMKYITVNPTWNVPPSIIRNEYLPALQQDPDALARVGLKIGHNSDGSIRIYQPPGEKNALGRIRFNFPNRFLVYQHDTPDKKLFARATRAYSHGCMRVQNPDQYAEVLLKVSQPEDNYTAARIRSMYGSHERTITFKHPIPVYITYQTAFVDDTGKPQTRPDIYGLDKETLAVLHGDPRIADVPVPRNYSSGSKPVMASAVGRGHSRAPDDEFDGWGRGGYIRGYYRSNDGWPGQVYRQNRRSAYQPADHGRVW
jgi:murein L,D-transpeptidase YcbB/YkuD